MRSYWNSVLYSAELDSAADFRAAASTGKQGFRDGRTAGRPHGLAITNKHEPCAGVFLSCLWLQINKLSLSFFKKQKNNTKREN